jgi:hypothetical protein
MSERSEQTVFIDDYLDAIADNTSRSGIDRKPFGPAQVSKGELDPSVRIQQDVPRKDDPVLSPNRGYHAVILGAQSGFKQPPAIVFPLLGSGCEN